MDEKPILTPATADDISDAIAFALLFNGRKRNHGADEIMARITAQKLVAHLELCGFVLMKKPAAKAPTTHSNSPR